MVLINSSRVNNSPPLHRKTSARSSISSNKNVDFRHKFKDATCDASNDLWDDSVDAVRGGAQAELPRSLRTEGHPPSLIAKREDSWEWNDLERLSLTYGTNISAGSCASSASKGVKWIKNTVLLRKTSPLGHWNECSGMLGVRGENKQFVQKQIFEEFVWTRRLRCSMTWWDEI